jgi:formamidopyrimidine-DNA glycosylase
MPELPDITVYVEALRSRISGAALRDVRIRGPFVLRSVDPAITEVVSRQVVGVERLGKRIVVELEGDVYLVIHLMVAGRLKWKKANTALAGRIDLAAFDFDNGTLVLTEAGTTKRASLHVVRGVESLREHNRGGLEVFEGSLVEFAERLRCENHTVKRSLTDPRLFSGIGNAYSDEILHRARLSPIKLTAKLSDEEIERLFAATRATLLEWTDRLRMQAAGAFPEKVTAFRPEMAVHGRFRQPCPTCGTPVQRIRYANNETNYCARCQTEGRLLADRALSRLLKSDWPRSIDEVL